MVRVKGWHKRSKEKILHYKKEEKRFLRILPFSALAVFLTFTPLVLSYLRGKDIVIGKISISGTISYFLAILFLGIFVYCFWKTFRVLDFWNRLPPTEHTAYSLAEIASALEGSDYETCRFECSVALVGLDRLLPERKKKWNLEPFEGEKYDFANILEEILKCLGTADLNSLSEDSRHLIIQSLEYFSSFVHSNYSVKGEQIQRTEEIRDILTEMEPLTGLPSVSRKTLWINEAKRAFGSMVFLGGILFFIFAIAGYLTYIEMISPFFLGIPLFVILAVVMYILYLRVPDRATGIYFAITASAALVMMILYILFER